MTLVATALPNPTSAMYRTSSPTYSRSRLRSRLRPPGSSTCTGRARGASALSAVASLSPALRRRSSTACPATASCTTRTAGVVRERLTSSWPPSSSATSIAPSRSATEGCRRARQWVQVNASAGGLRLQPDRRLECDGPRADETDIVARCTRAHARGGDRAADAEDQQQHERDPPRARARTLDQLPAGDLAHGPASGHGDTSSRNSSASVGCSSAKCVTEPDRRAASRIR